MTRSQNEKLADRIVRYWAERGYEVDAYIALARNGDGEAYAAIRSDMKNGLPRRKSK